MIVDELYKAVTISSKSSTRNAQKAIGPSEIGGCRRQTWLRLHEHEETNLNTIQFPAMYGTAIHAYILEAFKKLDPFGERYLLEQEWFDEATGLVGHIDCYDKETKEVIDWKSTKKNNLRYFPSTQQRWQVQLYGYLLRQSGQEVEKVTLVAIPRDGDERDLVYHTEAFDMEVVNTALAWLQDVTSSTTMPPADKDVSLCRHYCRFYDETGTKGCSSRGKAEAEGIRIENSLIDSAAKRYLEVIKQMSELEQEKDALKFLFEGVSGVTESGIKVIWSTIAGRKSIDESVVKELLGYIPYRSGNPSNRLSVRQ